MNHLLDLADQPVTPVPPPDAAQPHPSPAPPAEGEARPAQHAPRAEGEPAPRERSERKLASSRANGAKSRGPVTPEGKARASHNAIRHGLAGRVLLPDEDDQNFVIHRDTLLGMLKPQNPVAERIAETIIAAAWRQSRVWEFECALLADAATQHDRTIPSDLRNARGFRSLGDEQTLFLLDRYEARYDRQFRRWLSVFRQINSPDPDFFLAKPQSDQPPDPPKPKLPDEPNPTSEHSPTNPARGEAAHHPATAPAVASPAQHAPCEQSEPHAPRAEGEHAPRSFSAPRAILLYDKTNTDMDIGAIRPHAAPRPLIRRRAC